MGGYDTDEITIIRHAGYDSWNEPLAAEDVIVTGKILYKTQLVRDIKGEEVLSSAQISLLESVDTKLFRELSHEDVLKFGDVRHSIIRIDTPKAFGTSFVFKYVVFVK